jgi:hypothetical protein
MIVLGEYCFIGLLATVVLSNGSPPLYGRDAIVERPPLGDVVVFPAPDNLKTGATVSGELRQWHKVTLTMDGPRASQYGQTLLVVDQASETLALDVRPNAGPPGRLGFMHPNPFLDYRLTVTFTHESGVPSYAVPGYFAADGNAAETGALSGNKWRAHLSPDKPGVWSWKVAFVAGVDVSVDPDNPGRPYVPYDGLTGTFTVAETDKAAPDFRARGRLAYVGERYLRFLGSNEYFLKGGTDSPETLLAYVDFDGTKTMHVPDRRGWIGPADGHGLHEYAAHKQDWREGDPTWRGGKGRGLIGAINYLASKGMNALSFMPHTAGGDGENVWPWVSRNERLNFDVAKLAQWEIAFEHAQRKGLFLNFKMQEQENDSSWPHRAGLSPGSIIPEAMDGGVLGRERKLYTRELIARYGHHLAMNWNLGEETQMKPEIIAEWSRYFERLDPYDHHRVIHTLPTWDAHLKVYTPLLGDRSALTGPSMQTRHYRDAHAFTLRWIAASREAGKPWAVAYDEQGNGWWGVPPDDGFQNWDATLDPNRMDFGGTGEIATADEIRKYEIWAHYMAGGMGVELYFGYEPVHNDLDLEDFRSRDRMWNTLRHVLDFFERQQVPFWEMENHNGLIGNLANDNSRYCFAKTGELYLVYLPEGGTARLDLGGVSGVFNVRWYNPRKGGELQMGSVEAVTAGGTVALGAPPADENEDWLAVVRR